MARIDSIFNQETKKAEAHPKKNFKWIHYTKLVPNKKQYRRGSTPEEQENYRNRVEDLAMLIEADGKVLQNLIVRKINPDEYEIIVGHHRRDACGMLVEEQGKEQFAFLPCDIEAMSEVKAEFSLYSSNGFVDKTQYEIMFELENMKRILEEHPEEFPDMQTGRMVDRLAKKTGLKKSTVGEYLNIAKNLGEKGMTEFAAGRLKKSAAVKMASLSVKEQEQMIDEGHLSIKEIEKYAERNTRKEQAGQIKNLNNKTAQKEAAVKEVHQRIEEGVSELQFRVREQSWKEALALTEKLTDYIKTASEAGQ